MLPLLKGLQWALPGSFGLGHGVLDAVWCEGGCSSEIIWMRKGSALQGQRSHRALDIGPGGVTTFCPFLQSKRIAGMAKNLNSFFWEFSTPGFGVIFSGTDKVGWVNQSRLNQSDLSVMECPVGYRDECLVQRRKMVGNHGCSENREAHTLWGYQSRRGALGVTSFRDTLIYTDEALGGETPCNLLWVTQWLVVGWSLSSK